MIQNMLHQVLAKRVLLRTTDARSDAIMHHCVKVNSTHSLELDWAKKYKLGMLIIILEHRM